MTSLQSRIYGCWMGKSIGGTLGLPVEGQLGPLSLTFYDPVPTIAPPNDDLELQLVWLDIIEKGDGALTADDFGQAWLRHIHYMWDEYGRCRWNLRRGIPAAEAGAFENWFESGMGSPIRSEIWACLFPGDPQSAGYYAALDSSLDHGVEGIAGEVFLAVMQSLVAGGASIPEAINEARKTIPASCETAQVLTLIADDFLQEVEPWESRRRLLQSHDHENFTHAPINVGLAVWALLHGRGNFEKSILLSTNAGYDTDSSTATVGATIGLALGLESLPGRWKAPIGDGVYLGSGIRDLSSAPRTLRELTDRVVALIGKLERRSLAEAPWSPKSSVSLESLPGTIWLVPSGKSEAMPWANGELPDAIKTAGGGEWDWTVNEESQREIVFLAAEGGSLFLDGRLIAKRAAGLPYVPATHRNPERSRVPIRLGPGVHRIKVVLDKAGASQKASVILAYEDLHICPWTNQDMPHRAVL